MSNMTSDREARREVVESGLSRYGVEKICNRQAQYRVYQAIRREPGLRDLLEPVQEYLKKNLRHMQRKQDELRQVWEEKNQTGW